MSRPTALITGAAGFIGRYAVEEFIRNGWHVLAWTHRAAWDQLATWAQQGRVTMLQGDLGNPARVRTALPVDTAHPPEAIVHCAGRASDVGRRSTFRRANYEAVANLVRFTKEHGVGRFVYVSTTDVYGLRDFDGEGEDELPLRAVPANPYPEFKIAAEHLIRSELPDAQYAIVRPAQVWGVGDPTLTPRIVGFLRSSPCIVHFGRWRGGNRWPLAHVRNVAAALFLAATDPRAVGTAINVADGERTTMDEFYRLLAGIYLPSKHLGTLRLPFVAGVVWGRLVSLISNLLNLDHPFADPSHYALYAVSRNLDFGNQRFRDLMQRAGRTLVTREEGLRELAAEAHTGNV